MIPCRFVALHVVAITLHLACGSYAFASSAGRETPIRLLLKTVRYPTPSEYTYAPYSYYYTDAEFWEFDAPSVAYIHGFVAFFTAAVHAFVYLPTHLYLSGMVWNQGFFVPRWVEYAVSCSLMSIASTMSAGNDDFNIVVNLSLQGMALQAIGALIEQHRESHLPLFVVGTLINFGTSYSSLWYFLSTGEGFNLVQSIEIAAYGFYYGLFPLNSLYDARRRPNFQRTDWIYNVLSLTSKLALFWIQVGETERVLYDSSWSHVQIYVLGIALPLVLLCVLIVLAPSAEHRTFQEAPNESLHLLRHVARISLKKKSPPMILSKVPCRRPIKWRQRRP